MQLRGVKKEHPRVPTLEFIRLLAHDLDPMDVQTMNEDRKNIGQLAEGSELAAFLIQYAKWK